MKYSQNKTVCHSHMKSGIEKVCGEKMRGRGRGRKSKKIIDRACMCVCERVKRDGQRGRKKEIKQARVKWNGE